MCPGAQAVLHDSLEVQGGRKAQDGGDSGTAWRGANAVGRRPRTEGTGDSLEGYSAGREAQDAGDDVHL